VAAGVQARRADRLGQGEARGRAASVRARPVFVRTRREGWSTSGMPNIAFEVQHQLHTDWCWAAIAASVSRHYSPKTKWCQCRLASEMVRRTGRGRRDCCKRLKGRSLEVCNEEWFLASALRIIGRGGGRIKRSRLSFAAVQKSVRAGLPICARIGWPDGTGHFVVITGCNQSRNGDQWVYVEDPLHGHGTWLYAEFCTNYHYGGGRWTATFPVKGRKVHGTV
jgi:hypothetical protein